MDKIVSIGKQKILAKGAKMSATGSGKDTPVGKGTQAAMDKGKGVITAVIKKVI